MIQVISVGPIAILCYREGKAVLLLVATTSVLQNKLPFAFNIGLNLLTVVLKESR